MNWRKLLNLDLGSLIGGRSPGEPDTAKPVYWWTALGRLFRLTAPAPIAGLPRFSPSLLRRAGRSGWKGPVYWNARTWRRDVILVAEQLRSLIACNAPLAPGLAAAASEEQRIRAVWTPQRTTRLVRNVVFFGALFVLGGQIALTPDGFGSGEAVFMGLVLLGLAGWYLWALAVNRNSRTGVYLALERRIAMGASLSEAMGALPRFFPRHLANLVEAGEVSGDLLLAFEQFNDTMLASLSMHRQLKFTLTYIQVVMLMQLSVVSFILVKVLPVWAEILQEMNPGHQTFFTPSALASMPLLARVFPDMASLARLQLLLVDWGPVLISALTGYVLWRFVARFRRRRSWASRGRSSVLMYLPWFGGLVVRHNLGLVALMLHGLLRAGVPLDRALAMAMGSDLLPAYRHWLGELRARILQGDSLLEAMARTRSRRLIPDSFVGLLEAGERSGQLPAMFERIAILYRREAEKRMHVLAALVLPAGIFIMAYITLAIQTMVFGTMASMVDLLIV